MQSRRIMARSPASGISATLAVVQAPAELVHERDAQVVPGEGGTRSTAPQLHGTPALVGLALVALAFTVVVVAAVVDALSRW